MYTITQEDIDILLQQSKITYLKVELLNKNYLILDELQGNLIDGNLSIDAESSIRRTINFNIYVSDSSFIVGENNKFWLDKIIRVYIGYLHLRTNKIKWYKLGLFVINNNSYHYDVSTNSLSMSCSDLTANLTGDRNGYIQSLETTIPVGSVIRNVMISTITELGKISNYIVSMDDKVVPYDLQFPTGSTVYNIIEKLRDLYIGYETFFDVDGKFICQKKPSGLNDPISLDDKLLHPLIISEDLDISFTDVKNVTEIWGKLLESDRYAETVTNSGSQYNITFDKFELMNEMLIGFKANVNNSVKSTLCINNGTPYPIVYENKEYIPQNTIVKNKTYVVQYNNGYFYFLGENQVHAISKDLNSESPFYIKKDIGEIPQVLSNGDYENIYSSELAQQRADYENWKSTRLNDGIVLNLVVIPWLDVNEKIGYTFLNKKLRQEKTQYIIKKIDMSLSAATMTISAIKFYPDYPF